MRGGPFAGKITIGLKTEDQLFMVDTSETPGLVFPIKILVDVNTFVEGMEDLGPHSNILVIDVGYRSFEILVTVHINYFSAPSLQ